MMAGSTEWPQVGILEYSEVRLHESFEAGLMSGSSLKT